MRLLALSTLLLFACEASISGGARGTDVDASTGNDSSMVDADIGTDIDAGVDAAPACPNGRRVYLNFGPQQLVAGVPSDATQNRASWMRDGNYVRLAPGTTRTAPAYRITDPNRTTLIQNIVTRVTTQLAPYPIEVVTTRPASGPYVMIVFGGTGADVASPRYGAAVNELDCGDGQKSDLAWISDNTGGADPQAIANTVMGAIGFGLGLTATIDPLGCMCGWANGCQDDDTMACRLAPNIMRDPNATQLCPGVTTQDEVSAFASGFCQ